jgi:hypothetical protein
VRFSRPHPHCARPSSLMSRKSSSLTGTSRRKNRNYQSYLQLIKLIPSLKPQATKNVQESNILYYAKVSRHLHPSTHPYSNPLQLIEGANNARSDDVSQVKTSIANLLNSQSENPITPPLNLSTRDGRELQNNFVGRLLCPIKYNWGDPV